jgi:uncharacterized glyoxalase superfamily protein PhnB
MADPFGRPIFTPALYYKDPMTALGWLEKAFGFERVMLITDKDGNLAHSEMRCGGGLIMVGSEWTDYVASPASTGGRNTQSIHVHLEESIDAHCERAKAAGAVIVRQLENQFYGDRTYSARDLEGHVWSFGQNLQEVSRADAEKASGLKIEGWP